MISRDEALALLAENHVQAGLLQHSIASEAVMRALAREFGEDEELWGLTGLLHDVDYELYPEEHCLRAREILEKEGVDEVVIHAVQSHGYEICCDIAPENDMERTLFAVDELTGLVTAAAILRPSHSVMDMEVKSVKKKFKDRHFAAGCNRDVIRRGVERMGISLDELMEGVILGMRDAADALGLGMQA